ncbi:class I SAM-dependent methyltransferase [Ectothiorhodospiraceae bacterium 2226]|nr:class I SAM-dependent methyltransferase [Ectothiorhodospiraceae bacterium 2226]
MRMAWTAAGLTALLWVAAAGARDVPYVPTPMDVVEEMLELAEIGPDSVLYDLGSGDGRIVISAAKDYGARAVGIDIDPNRIDESWENARVAGVTDQVEFIEGNLFDLDLSEADAVTLYLLSTVNIKLRPKLLRELAPGTPVVSHAFDMGEWEPDEVRHVQGRVVYFWRVPAEVSGVWRVAARGEEGPLAFDLRLDQVFQEVHGEAEIDGVLVPLEAVRLDGDRLSFTVTAPGAHVYEFSGTVAGEDMVGAARPRGTDQDTLHWSGRASSRGASLAQ